MGGWMRPWTGTPPNTYLAVGHRVAGNEELRIDVVQIPLEALALQIGTEIMVLWANGSYYLCLPPLTVASCDRWHPPSRPFRCQCGDSSTGRTHPSKPRPGARNSSSAHSRPNATGIEGKQSGWVEERVWRVDKWQSEQWKEHSGRRTVDGGRRRHNHWPVAGGAGVNGNIWLANRAARRRAEQCRTDGHGERNREEGPTTGGQAGGHCEQQSLITWMSSFCLVPLRCLCRSGTGSLLRLTRTISPCQRWPVQEHSFFSSAFPSTDNCTLLQLTKQFNSISKTFKNTLLSRSILITRTISSYCKCLLLWILALLCPVLYLWVDCNCVLWHSSCTWNGPAQFCHHNSTW